MTRSRPSWRAVSTRPANELRITDTTRLASRGSWQPPLPPRAAGPHACTRTNALFRHARRLTPQLSPPCLARLHAAVRDRFDENVGADATGKRREEFERGKRMAALYGSNQGSRLVQKRTKQRGGRNLTPSVRERRQAPRGELSRSRAGRRARGRVHQRGARAERGGTTEPHALAHLRAGPLLGRVGAWTRRRWLPRRMKWKK